jgi:hypothetical protein
MSPQLANTPGLPALPPAGVFVFVGRLALDDGLVLGGFCDG